SPPSPPVASSPGSASAPGTSVTTASPTFQWSSVSGATKYGLYISITPYSSPNWLSSNTKTPSTSFTLPIALTSDGQDSWQVTAWNPSGVTAVPILPYWPVSRASPPRPPAASSPGSASAPGTSVTTASPTFQWSSVSGATKYGLYISI